MNVTVPDQQLTSLSAAARTELTNATIAYAKDLAVEASRLEAGQNTGAPTEVTATHIRDAKISLRIRPKKKRSIVTVIARLAAFGSAAFLGYGVASLDTGDGQAAFAGGVLVGAIATIVEFVKE